MNDDRPLFRQLGAGARVARRPAARVARVERAVELHGLLEVRQALVAYVEERRAALEARRRLLEGRGALLPHERPAPLRAAVLHVQLGQRRLLRPARRRHRRVRGRRRRRRREVGRLFDGAPRALFRLVLLGRYRLDGRRLGSVVQDRHRHRRQRCVTLWVWRFRGKEEIMLAFWF